MSKRLTYQELEQRVRELEASQILREQSHIDGSIESIQAGVVVHGRDGTVIKSNTTAQIMLGLTHEQMLGKELIDPAWTAWTFLRKDGSPLPVKEYPVSRVLATKKPVHNIVTGIQRSDRAEPIWVFNTAIPEFDENGHLTQIVTTFTDISALKKSEEQYRNLFDNMMHEVHLWKLVRDEQGAIKTWRLVEVNPAALKAWGKTRSEMIGKTTNEIFSYDATEQFMPIVKKIFSEGKPYTWEAYFPPTDQFYHMTSVSFGEYFMSTGTDITDRKQIEDALRESEERHRLFYNPSFGGSIIHDKGRILDCSKGITNITGYSYNELVGMNGLLLIAPDWRDLAMDKITEGFEDPYEVEGIRKDGTIFPLRLHAKAIQYHGKPAQVVEFRDISDIKKAEQALKKSENLLRNIIDSSTDYIFVKDKNLKTILCNQQVAQAVHKKPSDLIGKTDIENGWDAELVKGNPDKGIIGYEKYDLEALSGKIVQNTDTAIISGKTLFLDTVKIPLKDENNEIFGVLGISRDITEQKKARQALQASEEQFRTLVNASPFPIVVVDTAGENILHWSKSAQALFGHRPKTPAEWFSLAYPDPQYRQEVIDRSKPYLEKAQHSKMAVNTGEYHITCLDGSVKICEIYAQFISGYLVLTNNDITERKKQERQLFDRNQEFEKTLIATNCGTWHHDYTLDRIYCDPRTQNILGLPSPVVTFEEWFLNLHPDDKDEIDAIVESLQSGLTTNEPRISISFRILKDDQIRHIKVDSFINYSKGKPETSYGLVQDFTDYTVMKELLSSSQSRYRRLIDNLGDRFFMFSRNFHSGEFLYLSSGFESVFGLPISSVLNQHLAAVINWCPGELERFAKHHQELVNGECEFQHSEYSFIHPDGKKRYINSIYHLTKDEEGSIVSEGIIEDITYRKEIEIQLQAAATRDALTSLYNRGEIMRKLESEMTRANRYSRPLSLLLLDLDYFKKVNDQYGHLAGDSVLVAFAQTLLNAIREDDYAGRYGGEEFLVVLPETSIREAEACAERIRKDVEALEISSGKHIIKVTSSIGLAHYGVGIASVDDLIENADQALYKAKSGGRNCIRVFDSSLA